MSAGPSAPQWLGTAAADGLDVPRMIDKLSIDRRKRELDHVLTCIRRLRRDPNGDGMSTGERLVAALATADTRSLELMDYTVPEALDRIGAWVVLLLSREVKDEVRYGGAT